MVSESPEERFLKEIFFEELPPYNLDIDLDGKTRPERTFLKACSNADYVKIKKAIENDKIDPGKCLTFSEFSGLNLLMDNFSKLKPGVRAADCIELLLKHSSTEVFNLTFNPLELCTLEDNKIQDENLKEEYVECVRLLMEKGCLVPSSVVTNLKQNGVLEETISFWVDKSEEYREKYYEQHPEEAEKMRQERLERSRDVRRSERENLFRSLKDLQELSRLDNGQLSLEDEARLKQLQLKYKINIAQIQDRLSVGEPEVKIRTDETKKIKQAMRERDVSKSKKTLKAFLQEKAQKEKIKMPAQKSKEKE